MDEQPVHFLEDRQSLRDALAAAFESSADMMLITERSEPSDRGWVVVHVNPAFLEATGYVLGDVIGVSPQMFVPRGEPAMLAAAEKASHENADVRMDVPVSRKDGTWFWGSWHARTISEDDGKRRRVITIRDITDRLSVADRLASHSARLRQLHLVAASSGRSADRQIEAILEFGILSFDLESAYVGKIAEGMFTWEHMVLGAGRVNPMKSRVGEQVPLAKMALHLAIEARDAVAVEDLQALGESSLDPTLRSWIGAPLIVRGNLYGGVGFAARRVRERRFDDDDLDVMRLIAALLGSATERGIQEHRLDALAFHDLLTGLPNRALLDDRMNQTLASAKRGGRQFAVHMLDLDHFKAINDRSGHASGDEALKTVAERLASALRESDTLARVGGDEFVVLQPEVENEEDALKLADRLALTLRDPLRVGSIDFPVGVTIGIAMYPRDGNDVPTLLRNADRALYEGKAHGRGRIEFAQAPV
ncbi:MAG: diguanylate cyclase [Candidatus Eremiobacteraeota bacterium]|nr:diguanylate cyclase [Candidatus Eremiobacteraeota bacterium]